MLVLMPVFADRAGASDDWLYSDDWRVTLSPYSWLLAAEGDATVRGVKAEIDQDFSDILKKIDSHTLPGIIRVDNYLDL